ncbi:MAG: VOC family protein [Actinomycetia bacterium]|nr:VOC family protein [Actinomycetes bacterium]
MNLTSIVHVNVNCRDFDRSLAFYQMLGFELLTMVPATNTPEVAAAVGMPPYRVKGGLVKLKGESVLIDLLEWQEPHSDDPPYENLYHLGLARIALRTADLDADMAELKAAGVAFLSEPATVEWEGQRPTRFVCFRDPDGTVLELVE